MDDPDDQSADAGGYAYPVRTIWQSTLTGAIYYLVNNTPAAAIWEIYQNYANDTTLINQTLQLAEGNDQGGISGSVVGPNKTVSANTTLTFNTAAFVSSNSLGFNGGAFDGRYLYLAQHNYGTFYGGQITRYDTTAVFTAAASFSTFDTAAYVSSNSGGFFGALYDGRYVYYIPNTSFSGNQGLFVRYDTTNSFTSSGAYATFDMRGFVNSNSIGFQGGVFDGRYLYLTPYTTGTSGQWTRFDTTLTFTTTSSYATLTPLALSTPPAGDTLQEPRWALCLLCPQ